MQLDDALQIAPIGAWPLDGGVQPAGAGSARPLAADRLRSRGERLRLARRRRGEKRGGGGGRRSRRQEEEREKVERKRGEEERRKRRQADHGPSSARAGHPKSARSP